MLTIEWSARMAPTGAQDRPDMHLPPPPSYGEAVAAAVQRNEWHTGMYELIERVSQMASAAPYVFEDCEMVEVVLRAVDGQRRSSAQVPALVLQLRLFTSPYPAGARVLDNVSWRLGKEEPFKPFSLETPRQDEAVRRWTHETWFKYGVDLMDQLHAGGGHALQHTPALPLFQNPFTGNLDPVTTISPRR